MITINTTGLVIMAIVGYLGIHSIVEGIGSLFKGNEQTDERNKKK